MMLLFAIAAVVVVQALNVVAQSSQWCDSWTGVCFHRYYDSSLDASWGYVFPSSPRNEFIGIFTAPIRVGWLGASLGGGMRSNPLILTWVNNNTPLISVRYTAQYGPPPVMSNGPRLTILGTSGANATHQRIVYRCENCTTWSGGTGRINLDGTHTFGYAAHNSAKPTTPNNAGSSMSKHTVAQQFSLNTVNARSVDYDAQLARLVAAGPLVPGSPPPIITTTTSAVVTTPPITTPPITTPRPPTTTIIPPITITTTSSASGPTQSVWGQCGGTGWSGPTVCAAGSSCVASNAFFSQCVPN